MNAKEKMNLAKELYENTDLTKEQYLELCKLCDELDLSTGSVNSEPAEPSWDDIIEQSLKQ